MKKRLVIIFLSFCSLNLVACNFNLVHTVNTDSFTHSVNENSIDMSQKDNLENVSFEEVVFENMENPVNIAAKHLDELYDKENILYSPLSLNMALGMLQEGSNGKTLTDISTFLQKNNYGEFAKEYISKNKEEFEKINKWREASFDICNSLWIDEGLKLKDSFKDSLEDKFFAESFKVDYTDEKTVELVNNWISEKTKERIPKMLDDIPSDTLLTLINTIYFKDEWVNIGYLIDSNFTDLDGNSKEVEAARFSDNEFYYENDSAIGFGKNYVSGLSFIGILPKETGEFNLEDLDLAKFIESESKKYDVKVTIPKFEFESNSDLNKLFMKHGLASLFTNPDFSRISEDSLNLSQVLQGCNITFDEKGTTAAAATVMMTNKAAMPEFKEIKEIIFDRPFAFMIYDRNNEEVIFIGKVLDV